jgi:hypothetical protein
MTDRHITRIYVRRYSDTGQIVAYVDWANGSRTEATLRTFDIGHNRQAVTFGTHMHALFASAKAAGLRLQRETW